MASRRLFDEATIEIGQIPIVDITLQIIESYVKIGNVYKLALSFIKSNGSYQESNPSVKINEGYIQ
jgi:hypothetical protein